MIQPLDGPGIYKNITVTDTPQEVKVDVAVQSERKVVTIQPLGGDVYYGYDDSVDDTNGTKIFNGQWMQIEAGEQLPIWVVASTGDSIDVRITEVA